MSSGRALRHLLVFQVKLGVDALRDLILSPLSIAVFLIDSVRTPRVQDSLYLRLMTMGRRSDRVINLFDEYTQGGHYTIDETISHLEDALQKTKDSSSA